MRRTARRVFAVGSIALLFALTAAASAEPPAASDGRTPPSSPVPASAAAFAERAAGGSGRRPAPKSYGSVRTAVELMVLVATCGIVVAVYAAWAGGQRGKRVLMRIRRR
jgi:hypothetical protein